MSISFYIDHPELEDSFINMSNSNAFDVLKLIDPDFKGEYTDRWNKERRERIYQKIMKLSNTSKINALIKPTTIYQDPGKATIIDIGRDDGYIRSRINAFIEMLHTANKYNSDIVYA